MNKESKISRRRAESIIDLLNRILRNKPFCEGVKSVKFQRLAWELKHTGEWAFLVKDLKFKDGKPWCLVRLVATDDKEYIELFGDENIED